MWPLEPVRGTENLIRPSLACLPSTCWDRQNKTLESYYCKNPTTAREGRGVPRSAVLRFAAGPDPQRDGRILLLLLATASTILSPRAQYGQMKKKGEKRGRGEIGQAWRAATAMRLGSRTHYGGSCRWPTSYCLLHFRGDPAGGDCEAFGSWILGGVAPRVRRRLAFR